MYQNLLAGNWSSHIFTVPKDNGIWLRIEIPWLTQCFIFTVVRKFIDEDRLPHLLFYGPPGTGKTSTILACAKTMYSPKELNSMLLEVNSFIDFYQHYLLQFWDI